MLVITRGYHLRHGWNVHITKLWFLQKLISSQKTLHYFEEANHDSTMLQPSRIQYHSNSDLHSGASNQTFRYNKNTLLWTSPRRLHQAKALQRLSLFCLSYWPKPNYFGPANGDYTRLREVDSTHHLHNFMWVNPVSSYHHFLIFSPNIMPFIISRQICLHKAIWLMLPFQHKVDICLQKISIVHFGWWNRGKLIFSQSSSRWKKCEHDWNEHQDIFIHGRKMK